MDLPLLDRELSWLDFNRRVLAEAEDPSVPLLERLKFLSITAGNLDEFLMVRVGALRDLLATSIGDEEATRRQLAAVRDGVQSLMRDMYRCFDRLRPELAKEGIVIERCADLSKKEQLALAQRFDAYIAPILTPLAVDPGHPFPFLASQAVNLAIVLEGEQGEQHTTILKMPQLEPRFVPVPEGKGRFVPLESVIETFVGRLFTALQVKSVIPFRVLRNADLALKEEEVQDLLQSVETELRRRDRKEVVWMEITGRDRDVTALLSDELQVLEPDVFVAPSLLRLADLMDIVRAAARPALLDPPFNPRIPSQLATAEDIFTIIRRGDVLLHRPYDSFSAVLELVQSAAEDPDVLAIKMTLYRTGDPSAVVSALVDAVQRGKQVTAVVELQARFDEMKNIAWARRLELEGVQVVYGLLGIKTHCKVCLVVRREAGQLRRYVHLSTGNYNAVTARIYTDVDLLTADEAIGEDAARLMNILTGYSVATIPDVFDRNVPSESWRALVVAPRDYHDWVLRMIARETAHARAGRPAHIIAKMNALAETGVIEALYRASSAGVKIDLIVRGICRLVPGVDGLSENIRVLSVVDRFLEHSRIVLFRNGGETEVWVSSGDWMGRNFFSRVEVTFPILAPALKARMEEQILATCLADRVKGWRLQRDGTWKRRGGEPRVRSQERFIEITRSVGVRVGAYEEVMAKPAAARKRGRKKK